MTKEEFLNLVAQRDEVHRQYLEAKEARDQARAAAKDSLGRHRAKLHESSVAHDEARQRTASARREFRDAKIRFQDVQTEVSELHAAADSIKVESLAVHRSVVAERDDAERVCNSTWREYRELDQLVPAARLEMMGLTA